MTYRFRQPLRNSARIILLLLLVVPAAQAQRMLEPAEYLQDAKFRPLYVKALGAKSKTPWLAKMDGPASTTRKVQVAGTEYVLSAFCKNRDCGENNAVLLYSPSKGVVHGTIYENGKSTLIGDPPPAVAAELPKLWKIEWRQQR
ncbi:MAG TPA: Ivy family c-type lysozyme inhibitor [Burkholderiales bacterium]|nr:Ivy family c-type lysozyme inhibitor [Burkholderiales bacterium]